MDNIVISYFKISKIKIVHLDSIKLSSGISMAGRLSKQSRELFRAAWHYRGGVASAKFLEDISFVAEVLLRIPRETQGLSMSIMTIDYYRERLNQNVGGDRTL